jgi:hypothetical protein
MANPPTRTPATPATNQRQLPDHVTSPGLSKMVAALMEDAHEALTQHHNEHGTTRTATVTLDILKAAYQQLGTLHDAPSQG